MQILILNQDWFAQELRDLGHDVLTAGYKFASHLELTVDAPFMHIDRLIQLAPDDFKPDVILIHDNSAPIVFTGFDETEIPTIFYSVDTHHHAPLHRYLAEVFDYTFVAQRDYIPFFQEWGQNPEWLPLYASRYVEASSEREYGAVFVGTLNANLNPDRVAFFDALRAKTDVLCTSGEYWKIFPVSDIVINQTVKGDLNFRVFESMMCGSMLLTERSGNGLFELFEEGKHLVTYEKGNVEEAAQKISYYLKNLDEARRIAHCGREEILRAHTPAARAQQIADILPKLTKKRSKQKFLAMMVNYTCFARSSKNLETGVKIVAFASALKSAEYALRYREEMDNAYACHLVIAAHDYDRYTGGHAGYDLLLRFQECYETEQIINLATVRAALNRGQIEKAKTIVDALGIEDMHATYQNAEQIIRKLLDSV